MPRYKLTRACYYVINGVAIRVAAGKVISNDLPLVQGDVQWPGGVLPDGAIPVGQAPPVGTTITGGDSIDA
jgi:hypothetical protein